MVAVLLRRPCDYSYPTGCGIGPARCTMGRAAAPSQGPHHRTLIHPRRSATERLCCIIDSLAHDILGLNLRLQRAPKMLRRNRQHAGSAAAAPATICAVATSNWCKHEDTCAVWCDQSTSTIIQTTGGEDDEYGSGLTEQILWRNGLGLDRLANSA